MRTFNIHNKDYYDERQLYQTNKITLKEHSVTCLIGCNGIGKTTLLRQLVHDNDNSLSKTAWDMGQNFKISLGNIFNNEDDTQDKYSEFYFEANKNTRLGKSLDNYDMHELFGTFQSTGERTTYNFVPIFTAITQSLSQIEGKEYYLLFDDFDVGTSIDVLDDFVKCIEKLQKLLEKHNVTYYIVLTANAYELVKHFTCIDCITMKEKSFTNYEDYANYVNKTREYKEKRDEY